MRRLILAILILLSLYSSSSAFGPMGRFGTTVAAGGGGGAWNYGVGSDTYAGTYNTGTAVRNGDNWTPGVNGTITKIGIKVDTVYEATAVNISLWENVTGTWTRRACGNVAGISAGWVDLTISPFTVTSGMELAVFGNFDRAVTLSRGAVSGGLEAANTYATECSDTSLGAYDESQIGVRVFVE